MRLRWLWLVALGALAGCTLESIGAGGACRRSTECQAGLGCVQRRCSRDLGPIAEESTVPEIGGGAADATMPAADGGAPAADGG